jgi:hypothetical protein
MDEHAVAALDAREVTERTVAAAANSSSRGFFTVITAGANTQVAKERSIIATTSSPTASSVTPSPTALMMPAHSLPSGPGSPGYMPSALSTSRKLSPVANTRIST